MNVIIDGMKRLETLDDLRRYLVAKLPDASIYLFGSRARGDASAYSDADIAIAADRPLDDELARIRDVLEESHIPFTVDLVDLKKAPYLATVVKKEGKRWH